MDAGQNSGLPEALPTDQPPVQPKRPVVKDIGFTILYDGSGRDGEDALVDIIFVHGLGGGPEKTWSTSKPPAPAMKRRRRDRLWPKSSGKKPAIDPSQPKVLNAVEGSSTSLKPGSFWPADFLPAAFPRARILTWGYDSSVTKFFSGAADKGTYISHANDLLFDINLIRAKNGRKRPIVWVTHSLGGILIKKVLLDSHLGFGATTSRPLGDIYESTKKVIFLGTPHRGSPMASWGKIATEIVKAAGFDTNDEILKQLNVKSPGLGDLNEHFIGLWRRSDFDVVTFQESRGMASVRGVNRKVVEDSSSTLADEPHRTIPGNHIEMCQFSDKDETGYLSIEGEVLAVIIQTENTTGGRAVGETGRTNSDRLPEPGSVVTDLFQHIDLSEHLMPDISIFGDQPFLYTATENGDEPIVRKLLARGAKIDEEKALFVTDLFLAVSSDKVEIVDLLLNYGAIIDKRCPYSMETPLIMATRLRSRTIVELLVQRGANIQLTDRSGKTSLHLACECGDEGLVAFLLEKEAGIEQRCSESMDTPLLLATRLGQSVIIDLLIRRGAATEVADAKGKTPLHIVSELGDHKIAKLLLNGGANIEAKESRRQRTPLHYAAENGNLAVAKELLERKAHTNTQDGEYGTAALHLAAQNGHTDIVSLLISKGAAVDIALYTSRTIALHLASANGHDAVVKILVNEGADVTAPQHPGLDAKTSLHLAAQNGHHLVLKLLCLDVTIDKRDESGSTALLLAALGGHLLAVKTLLESGTDIEARNNKGIPALFLALREGHKEVAILLLNEGASTKWPGAAISPLQYAAHVGQISVVQKLLDLGADAQEKCRHGETALHYAASVGHTAILSLLLAKNAELDSQSGSGCAALHEASRNGYGDAVRLLLNCGATVTLSDNIGMTALHCAASRGHEDVVRLLIGEGADCKATDVNFLTPLHYAAASGHINVIPWLLRGDKTTIDALDSKRRTPLGYACMNGHASTVKVLIVEGAQVVAPEISPHIAAAAVGGHLGVVEILQSHRDGDASIGDVYALFAAATHGHAIVIEKLLSWEGLDINAPGPEGITALHCAAFNGHDSAIRMLLKKGANIDQRSDKNWLPIHHAALNGHACAIRTLLDAGSGLGCLQDMFTEDLSSLRRLDPDGLVRFFVAFARSTKRNHTTIEGGDTASTSEQATNTLIVNMTDNNENQAIHTAVTQGHVDLP